MYISKIIMNSVIVKEFSKINYDKKSIVTIGKFDGVHKGHQKILGYASEYAKNNDLISVAIIVRKQNKTIYDFDKNIEYIKFIGINYIIVIDFSEKFYKMTAEYFFLKLIENYNMSSIVVGSDFMFGNDREGDINFLREYSKKNDIEVKVMNFSAYNGEKISTTNIRKYLELGYISSVSKMLNRNYAISGIVETGRKIGRTIGYPTINIYIANEIFTPKEGVYFALVSINGTLEQYEAMMFIAYSNLNKGVRLEAHLLGFSGDIYGVEVSVTVLEYSRENVKVESLDNLKELLKIDEINTINYFKRRSKCLL